MSAEVSSGTVHFGANADSLVLMLTGTRRNNAAGTAKGTGVTQEMKPKLNWKLIWKGDLKGGGHPLEPVREHRHFLAERGGSRRLPVSTCSSLNKKKCDCNSWDKTVGWVRTGHHRLRRVAVAEVCKGADDGVDARHHDFGARTGDHESL